VHVSFAYHFSPHGHFHRAWLCGAQTPLADSVLFDSRTFSHHHHRTSTPHPQWRTTRVMHSFRLSRSKILSLMHSQNWKLTMGRLRDSGKYTDFVITCGDDTYDVHKAVVCARSGFFERAEQFPVGLVRFNSLYGHIMPWISS